MVSLESIRGWCGYSKSGVSVSLNGSIHGFFKGGRGLRQGDPMSPYLFVLVMEIWNLLLKFRIKEAANFQYHWKCKDIGLINLCFADDVLLFCKAHLPSIIVICDALNEFAALSGLKVNPAKSQIIFSRAVQQERQQILDYLGFQEGSLPVKYLGILLTSSRLTIADCRPLIDKVDARLAGWNNQILSYAGRLQLIKSVLSTLHTHWTLAFILPKGVLKTLKENETVPLARLGWKGKCEAIQAPTFDNLDIQWCIRIVGLEKDAQIATSTSERVIYKIGDGSSFSLWQDPWHERGPLCFIFPRGPEVIGLPLSSPLSSVIQRHQWCWPASTDTEFIGLTSQLPPLHSSAVDCISWRSSSGTFTVRRLFLSFNRQHPVFWRKIRFQWPFLEWQTGLIWASKRWRGTHLINAAFRATLAALVYHLWAERNNRKFSATSASAEYITSRVLDDIRMRILPRNALLVYNLQICIEFGIWKGQ
ncbi:hypothetical protein Sango_3039000 [Sesamum angolense]|uniref:Reverse transcriptase domain-containing protein n=1 Tax=Sesamum angolense TaxID=2727404 RepID=A0AAE1W1E0_9LAMI|nr:hypothetical protein Sango_3039000 [Sesamum angolense]